jgi:FkbM family methyltransferase
MTSKSVNHPTCMSAWAPLAISQTAIEDDAPQSVSATTYGEFQHELFQGLLRDCYEFHDKNTDFWRFQSTTLEQFKVWIKDKILLLARKKGFILRDRAIEKGSKELTFVLENLGELENLYHLLGDAYSKHLLIELLKFRILGRNRVKLPVNTQQYWDEYKSIDKKFLRKRRTIKAPWNWDLNRYQLPSHNGFINLHADFLDVLNIFILEQYAYRKGHTLIQVQSGDTVIDGGGCWGDSTLYFASKAGAQGKIYCFEFAPENLEILRRNIDLNEHVANHIEVITKALWDRSGETIPYSPDGPATSLVKTKKNQTLQMSTLSIDDLVKAAEIARVDYIKMDIEGSELKALQGAEKTIRTFRPKLAISLYHKEDDFVVIPSYLDKLSVGYEFFLDHFTIHTEETVLFARPKD